MKKIRNGLLISLIFLVSCNETEVVPLAKLNTPEVKVEVVEEIENTPPYLRDILTEVEPSFSKMNNIINNGYVIEDDSQIIFSDSKGIYIIHKKAGIYEKLSSVSGKFLNLYGNDLFYYNEAKDEEGIYKLNLASKESTKIYSGYTDNIILYDGFLYMQEYTNVRENTEKRSVSKISTDGDKISEIFSYEQNLLEEDTLPLYFYISNGYLYYVEKDANLTLCKIDLDSNRKEEVASSINNNLTLDDFIIDNDYVYYTKKATDEKSPLYLYRYNMTVKEAECVISHRVWSYSINDEYIYYVGADREYNLFRRKKWDNSTIRISDRSLTNVNVTSNLIYVEDNFDSGNRFWYTEKGRELNLGFGNNNNFFDYSIFIKSDI